jgi:REP element-mobilizing transposase RayT
VHFLIQSVPKYNVTEIVRMIKSITVKKIFEKHPEVKNNYGVENFGQMDFS